MNLTLFSDITIGLLKSGKNWLKYGQSGLESLKSLACFRLIFVQ
jgi:hypothetical protein